MEAPAFASKSEVRIDGKGFIAARRLKQQKCELADAPCSNDPVGESGLKALKRRRLWETPPKLTLPISSLAICVD